MVFVSGMDVWTMSRKVCALEDQATRSECQAEKPLPGNAELCRDSSGCNRSM